MHLTAPQPYPHLCGTQGLKSHLHRCFGFNSPCLDIFANACERGNTASAHLPAQREGAACEAGWDPKLGESEHPREVLPYQGWSGVQRNYLCLDVTSEAWDPSIVSQIGSQPSGPRGPPWVLESQV